MPTSPKPFDSVQEFAKPYVNRGAAYTLKGDYSRAIADFTEAIRLNPDNAEAYQGRGIVHEGNGDKSKAEGDFAKAKQVGLSQYVVCNLGTKGEVVGTVDRQSTTRHLPGGAEIFTRQGQQVARWQLSQNY